MSWFFIAIFVVILWVVSLCFILYASCTPSMITFLSSGAGRRNVLLVVAHPDDESMFFSPTILYLTSRGHSLHLLCLSTGDADGKGSIRKEELYKACAVFKVPLQQVKTVDHPALQDGFDNTWSHHLLAKIIKEEVKEKGIDLLITFDHYGVSGHPNHVALHHGVCMVLSGNSHRNIEAWELISTNTVRKYMGPVDIWLSILCSIYSPSGQMYCLLNRDPHKSFLAMAQHRSQWVCFTKCSYLWSIIANLSNAYILCHWWSINHQHGLFSSIFCGHIPSYPAKGQVPEVVCVVVQLHIHECTQKDQCLAASLCRSTNVN